MKENFKKIEESAKTYVEVLLSLPPDFSRDTALSRMQESVWWANKLIDEEIIKEKTKAVKE